MQMQQHMIVTNLLCSWALYQTVAESMISVSRIKVCAMLVEEGKIAKSSRHGRHSTSPPRADFG